MANNNIYSVGIDIGEAKKELKNLLDYYEKIKSELAKSIDTNGITSQVDDMKAAIRELEKSLALVAKTKVNDITFANFDRNVTKQIDDLNQRTTLLETTVGKLISTMSTADGGSFKKWISDIRAGMKELEGTAKSTMDVVGKVVNAVGEKGAVQIVDRDSLLAERKELEKIRDLLDAVAGKTPRLTKQSGVFAKTNADALNSQLRASIESVEELQKKLSSLKPTDATFSSTQSELVAAADKLYDKYAEIFISMDKLRLSSAQNDVFKGLTARYDAIFSSLRDNLASIHLQIEEVNKEINTTSSKSIQTDKSGQRINVPIYISTTGNGLATKALKVISTAQNAVSKQPIEVGFKLVSDKKYSEFGQALKEFEAQIKNIQDPVARNDMSKIADDLSAGFGREIFVGLRSSLVSSEQAIKGIVDRIRNWFKEANNQIVIEPKVQIPKDNIDKFREQINAVANELSDIVAKGTAEGLEGGSEERKGNSIAALKKKATELSTLLSTVLPKDIHKLDGEFEKLNNNKMGSANAQKLADNLARAYSTLTKIVELTSGD